MRQDGVMNFLSLNRSITNMGDEVRQFSLPRMNPFPKLDARIVRSVNSHHASSAVSRPGTRGTLITGGSSGYLPEMATDVIDSAVNYAVENVKRDRSGSHSWSRMGFGHLVGRMLGNHRAAHL
jgi:hypothetical protein